MKRAAVGETNNRLTLVELIERRKGGYRWRARCDCGGETIVTVRDFRSGHTKSCGCLRREITSRRARVHGKSDTPEFRVWCHMLGRCYNESDGKFGYYGGRGIRVCERWHSFSEFYRDMGQRPTPYHSIDRINVDGDYSPSNCRWATTVEQAQNKRNNVRVTLLGMDFVIAQAERFLGIGSGSINQRVRKRGETHQKAAEHFLRRYEAFRVAPV